MKRAISYSDSFLILNKKHEDSDEEMLTPILIPTYRDLNPEDSERTLRPPNRIGSLNALDQHPVQRSSPPSPRPSAYFSAPEVKMTKNTHEPLLRKNRSPRVMCFLLTFKLSFHLFLISAFETLFYFLYVNRSEDAGILKTIDNYYQPIVANCTSRWSNSTKWVVDQMLQMLINQTQIDENGHNADIEQSVYNQRLLNLSIVYSGVCVILCAGATFYGKWQQWKIPWRRIIAENLGFVILLGLYELFFFKTIIYKYDTMSSAQLNRYIVDGLAQCALS
jgi:hypothetical protein